MSWNAALDPHCPMEPEMDAIETRIIRRARAVGTCAVRRAVPSAARQMSGPFDMLLSRVAVH